MLHSTDDEAMKKVAIVTGGTSGIGLATVSRLLADGYKVGFFGSDAAKAALVTGKLVRTFDKACFLGCVVDARSPEAIKDFCATVRDRFGPPGALVNCAGISPKHNGRRIPLHEISLEHWNEVLDVNLTTAFLCTKNVLPSMVTARYGRIVTVGSSAARTLPRFAGSSYVASKAALYGLTRSIVSEYAADGVTANMVSPGNVVSAMTGEADSVQNLEAAKLIPVGRLGLPGEIADSIVYLCSPGAGFINGAIIDVTGGEYVPG